MASVQEVVSWLNESNPDGSSASPIMTCMDAQVARFAVSLAMVSSIFIDSFAKEAWVRLRAGSLGLHVDHLDDGSLKIKKPEGWMLVRPIKVTKLSQAQWSYFACMGCDVSDAFAFREVYRPRVFPSIIGSSEA